MRKATIILSLLFLSLFGFSQNSTATGKVMDLLDNSAIPNAIVKVKYKSSIFTYTNEKGEFSIEVPKSYNKLTVQNEKYIPNEILLEPGFQKRENNIYLKPSYYDELL